MYNLDNVTQEVRNGADVIVHFENIEVEVESLDKVVIKSHKIYTVINEDGKSELLFHVYASKFISLEEAEIKVYDANGKQTGKYKKKDMRTIAMGEGLIEDGYEIYFPISVTSYPVTVDVKYEQRLKSTLFFPDYRFISPREGVVESSYTAKIPAEMSLRYKAKNTFIEPNISEDGKYKIYKWTIKNLAPIEYEPGSVAIRNRYPHILIVPNKFSHYGFNGDFSSWKNFGTWIRDLYQGLDVLPADRQQFYLTLTKDAASEKEKIKRIYSYMQQNFRYVSIQLGIGGMRPFPAEFTDQKKYGDCKGLSNYMKAALKAAGIKSYIGIINREYNGEPADPDFPANEFNHAILCVPGIKDSIWLECTSSTAEMGELETTTQNRNALLITDEGGVLVSTPKSRPDENILSMVSTVTISTDLSGMIETIFTSKGEFKQILNDILKDNKDEQKQAIVSYFGFKQPDDFILTKESSNDNKVSLTMAITKVPEFNAGNKLFLPSHIHKMWSRTLPKAENRKSDFYFIFPFEKRDTTIFKFPAGIKPDVLPKETELKCDYAIYKTTYWYSDKENAIYSAALLILKQHKISASDYSSVKKFFDNMAQDDAQKMVVQKTAEQKGF
jgi:hypothetical protein